jgi:hypothetical protein
MPVVGSSAYQSASDVFSMVRSMINDADIPAVVTITSTGAARAGNLVTITTQAPHFLQEGSVVQVGSVTDSSFNGTQTVTAVPTSTTFQYNQAGANSTSGNGIVSVLIQGDWATDAVLLPVANKAYRKVQRRMKGAGSTTFQKDVIISSMPIGMIILDDASNPQLPVDFIAPREIWERQSTQPFFGPKPMTRVNYLPSWQQSTYNGCYTWQNEAIQFVGATAQLDLRLDYIAGYPALSDGTSPILIRDAADVIASHTAYLITNSRAPESAGVFNEMYEQDMQELLNVQTHARQYKPARRQPNNRRHGYGFCR